MSTTQAIKLDDETSKRLKALAEQRNRSAHFLMREALERYLTDEEHYEREKAEDTAAYEEYLETDSAIDNDEVVAWLNELAKSKNIPWQR